MLIADPIILDPKEFLPSGAELDLSAAGFQVVEADFGEADLELDMQRHSVGEVPTNWHPPNTTTALKMVVRAEGKVDLPTAAYQLAQKVGEINEPGTEHWLRRDFLTGGDFAGSLGRQVFKAGLSGLGAWQKGSSPEVALTLATGPYWYATTEVESQEFIEALKRELIWELSEVLGTAPSLIRIIVKNNNSSGDWRGLVSAIESRDHPQDATASTTAALAYRCADLTPKGGAEATGGIEPKVRAVGAVASGNGAISPGLPAGTVQGDLLIMVAESGGATASTEANTALTAAGWSSPPAPYADQKKGNTRLTLLYKIASGGDATTTNDTGDHQVARIVGIEAGTFDSENPFNTAGVGTQAATKAVSIPGGTTTRDRSLVIACASGNLPDASSTTEFGAATNASLTGLTELFDNTVTAGDGGAIYAVVGVMATKGTYSATTCTAVTEAERGVASIAINAPYVVRHKELTAGWLTILESKIVGVGHMTHKGVRRLHLRIYDPGTVAGNVQLRLRWRALGTLQWSENKMIPTPLVGGFAVVDLGEARPEQPAVGGQRWEWQVQARALNGSGIVDLARARIYPAEQLAVVRAPAVPQGANAQSAKVPGEATTSGSGGEWKNPNNVKSSDDLRATAELIAVKTPVIVNLTQGLAVKKFGFALPEEENTTITGVVVEVERSAEGEGSIRDYSVTLLNGTGIGASLASPVAWPTTDAIATYGSSTNLWGLGLTPKAINAAAFGVEILCTGSKPAIARIDSVRITVYYAEKVADENRACFAGRSMELRSDDVVRQHLTEEIWGRMVPEGFLPYAPPSGMEQRVVRGVIAPTQGDIDELADTKANRLSAVVKYRPAYLFAREAS
jgi:hypothetical protein